MIKIAVTRLEYDKAKAVFGKAGGGDRECLRAPAEEKHLAEFVVRHGIRHAVVGVERYARQLYETLPAGSVLARFGVGHDGIDKSKATEGGILCTNTPGVLDDSVAEHTLVLMGAAARHVPEMTRAMKGEAWNPCVGGELRHKTLALIGCGNIGKQVAKIASAGFGMEVIGCELLDVDVEEMKRDFGFSTVVKDFGSAVAEADYVSLHIPSTTSTRHFLNRDRIRQCPSKAWLINTARGAVVDEAALYDALVEGGIAGAALDVFEREPYEPVDPGKDLRTLDNVIMTPHVGSSTREACERMATRALQNIQLAERGDYDKMDLLNREVVRQLSSRRSYPGAK